ncbi:hypothetical protein K2173_004276 [Erythroxylum novogranatense]|uniref:Acyl-coenzyme A thioesterase 13 n=1 Tax=Erythroxylum novogranatense TaxID=1862640 RepID=A0AAV8U3R4_9ROSI|nr:hypothetical protein K2173_004276 [Erythroxylum novogranatense]
MGDPKVERSNNWLRSLSTSSHELEALSTQGLQVVESQKGFIRCNFIVSDNISDADGNWYVGAMATLIDDVGAAAVYSLAGEVRVSVDFNISIFSAAKLQEEVEIEAKVVGEKETITSVLIEVRKKDGGQVIALGKQWMASHNKSRL